MSRQQLDKEFRSFTNGKITEVNPLSFPENSAKDLDNIDIDRDGSVARRRGVDFEPDFVLRPEEALSGAAVETDGWGVHKWVSVAREGGLNFIVVQRGLTLDIYQSVGSSLSSTKVAEIDFSSAAILTEPVARREKLQSASGNGLIFFTGRATEPFYLEYDIDDEEVNLNIIEIKIRDFEGIDDGLEVDERPNNLTPEHLYNLLNQGWADLDYRDGSTSSDPPDRIADYETAAGKYPSNAQIWYASKDGAGDFDPAGLDKIQFGKARAPRGFFIHNAFHIDRADTSNIGDLDEGPVVEKNRPVTTEFFASRVWYAGTDSDRISGNVYFSQVLDGDSENVGNCFQKNDPTSEFVSSLAATDGGVIPITNAERIVKLASVFNGIAVFATNGVWFIAGGEGGFRATDFQITKLSSEGTISPNTVISGEGAVFYWSESGIQIIFPDQETGQIRVENITEDRIQSQYVEITNRAKEHAVGIYDTQLKRFTWLYNDGDEDAYDGIEFRYNYNKSLIFDLRLQAFYEYTFEGEPLIAGIFKERLDQLQEEEFNVFVGSDQVLVGTDEVVTESVIVPRISGILRTIFLTIVPEEAEGEFKYTFSVIEDEGFRDWRSFDGEGIFYNSFIETGDEIAESLMRDKQALYLYSFFERTEDGFKEASDGGVEFTSPSDCRVQARWEWADSSSSGRWSREQKAYILRRSFFPQNVEESLDFGFPVTYSRLKLRGKGKAISLRFRSVEDKNFKLLGFAIPFNIPRGVT